MLNEWIEKIIDVKFRGFFQTDQQIFIWYLNAYNHITQRYYSLL